MEDLRETCGELVNVQNENDKLKDENQRYKELLGALSGMGGRTFQKIN